jgi:folate-binding protein YgfZ
MPETTKSELAAILTGAAIFPLDDRAFLRITGSDATRWLNGMVTNSIQSLAPGEGNYNFLLNAQGRIQGDCTIYREHGWPTSGDPTFLLETDPAQIDTIEQLLDKFIIMDDVELSRTLFLHGESVPPDALKGLALTGPKAGEMLTKVMFENFHEFLLIDAPAPSSFVLGTHGGKTPSFILTPPGRPDTFEIWSSTPDLNDAHSEFKKLGAVDLSAETIEAHRILSGQPRYGQDIRNSDIARDLPQETNQTHALHFSKGCYLGQEIVERIRSRGQVHRTFTTFELTALPTSLPAPLTSEGKPAGEITSAANIPLPEGDRILALGYARREALDRHQPLTFEGGTATPTAQPERQ